MSFSRTQLREKIQAVLLYLDPAIPYSETAVELLMLTCAQETHLGKYLKQIIGPARGIFQVEPNTETDIWRTLTTKPQYHGIRILVSDLMFPREDTGITNMELNLAYQIAMARVYYYRIPSALPKNSAGQLAGYWKKYYNTKYGRGTVSEAVKNYFEYAN